ncbi:MAG: alpha/beta hydrolase [Synechococcaceae cyanobacterium SM2_3_1]|nr:alpha/beta hydrolase [Synechococcaceae cyanobacterium SM2_3_1]
MGITVQPLNARSAINLYRREWGPTGASTSVLMLHGHPGNADCMSVFASALDHECRLIAPDLRGYGRSRTSSCFSMTDHLIDLVALLDELALERCLILGWSLGGILALELALRYPERVQGLVLVATAARPVGSHPPTDLWDDLYTGVASILNWIWPGWSWNIDTFGRRSLYRYLIQQHTPETYHYLATAAVPAYLYTSGPARQALRQALQQRYSCLEHLPQLAIPTLMMAAEQDLHITCQASYETVKHLSHAEWICYSNTAHLFPWEIPQQVQQDLQAWFIRQGWLSTPGYRE